jgi:hypothetical protein
MPPSHTKPTGNLWHNLFPDLSLISADVASLSAQREEGTAHHRAVPAKHPHHHYRVGKRTPHHRDRGRPRTGAGRSGTSHNTTSTTSSTRSRFFKGGIDAAGLSLQRHSRGTSHRVALLPEEPGQRRGLSSPAPPRRGNVPEGRRGAAPGSLLAARNRAVASRPSPGARTDENWSESLPVAT